MKEETNPFKVIEAADSDVDAANDQEVRDLQKQIIDLESNKASTDDAVDQADLDVEIAAIKAKIAKLQSKD